MQRFLISYFFGALLVTITQGATNFELASKATNELGVDLHRQLATDAENLCISPYSINSALAMTFLGADGGTRSEMARVLHFPNGGDVPASFSALQHSLEQMSAKTADLVKESKKFGGPSEPITLNIANRLFAQKTYHFREAFLSLLKQNFGGAFEPLDFVADPAAATQRINKWVADQTRDRIRDLIPGGAQRRPGDGAAGSGWGASRGIRGRQGQLRPDARDQRRRIGGLRAPDAGPAADGAIHRVHAHRILGV